MLMYVKLAWRNIWRNKRRTLITVSSVTFAVFFAMLMRSMGEGSYDMMIENMARFHTGFIQVQDVQFRDERSLDNAMAFDEKLSERIHNADNRIDFLVPRIDAFMLVASDESTRSGMMVGIEPELENRFNKVKDHLTAGRFFHPDEPSVVLGNGFARRLKITVGDSLVLLGQGRFGMTAAGIYPVAGLIDHPVTDMDNQIVYLKLSDAQWLLSAEGYITSLLVTPVHPRFSDTVAESLRRELGGQIPLRADPGGHESMQGDPGGHMSRHRDTDLQIPQPHDPGEQNELVVLTWQELMPELLQAIEFDRAGAYVILAILYIVIGFGLFGTILTMTLERMREFGVLLSVGMQRLQLSLVVFLETLFISIIGVFGGFLVSFPILYYLYHNPVYLKGDAAETMLEFGVEPILPISLAPELFQGQMIIVFLITMLISLYPLFKILRLNILDAAKTS